MENKANYALIGAFVLIALAATVLFILWLTDVSFDQQFDEYEVSFTGPVRGLSPGSEVRFNGINVGQVTAIRLDEADPNTVLADIRVVSTTPVDTKSYAALEPLGLTGLNYLQIFSGGEEFPLIKDLPGRGPKRIQGRADTISELIEGGGSVVEQAQIALAGINRVLDQEAIEDLHAILANINRITSELDLSEVDGGNINGLISDMRETAQEYTLLAQRWQETASKADVLMEEDITETLAALRNSLVEIDETMNAFENTSGVADELLIDTREAVNRLSNSGLRDIEETVAAIRNLVLSLGRVADALEQNPLGFISGSEADSIEIPQ